MDKQAERVKVNKKWCGVLACVLCAIAIGVAAQSPGSKRFSGGNPTPGTPQPDPPDLADRIALTGCLQSAQRPDSTAPAVNAGEPSSSKFVLVSAERLERIPQDTGTSNRAKSTTSRTYKLKGIDSQLSPFAGSKVEISGEVTPSSGDKPGADPELLVEFVQRIATKCP